MAVTEWKFPSLTTMTVNNVGGSGVINPEGAYVDDPNVNVGDYRIITSPGAGEDFNYAIAAKNGSNLADEYVYSGFGFTEEDIPRNSTIDGFEVRLVIANNTTTAEFEFTIGFPDNTLWSDTQTVAVSESIKWIEMLFGGPTNNWGFDLSDAFVRTADFGIHSYTTESAGNAHQYNIDTFQLRVYYTEGNGRSILNTGNTADQGYDGSWTTEATVATDVPTNSRFYPMNDRSSTIRNALDSSGATDGTITNYTDNWELP